MSDRSREQAALRLFERALSVPEAMRDAWLETSGADRAVVSRARALLEADRSAGGAFLTGGAGAAADVKQTPERIGSYRIASLIGRGGMGAVYLGERDAGDFEHRVAIKVVRPGPMAAALIERFRGERRILASLDHPNIARLFDGGETAEGAPYFVMEHVEGRPLFALLDEAPPLVQRLGVFMQACRAVAYAHQKLVVHGDVTPANILVRADGEAKLIDFGISRIDDIAAAPAGPPLKDGAYTHDFAAPERRAGEPASTAADVYALGAVLRAVIGADGDAELSAIAAKATAQDRERRYGSVAELIADLERRDAGLPVEAVQGGRGYRARKLVVRHRWLFGTIAAGVLGLTVALALVAQAYRQAEAARAAEARRFNEVRTLAGFMLFDLNGRLARVPGNTLARVELANEAQTYLSSLARSPHAPAALRLDTARGLIQLALIQGVPPDPNLGEREQARANLATADGVLAGLAGEGPLRAAVAAERAKVAAYRALLIAHRDTDIPAATKALAEAERHLAAVAPAARTDSWREARRWVRRGQAEAADLGDDMPLLARRAAQLEGEIAGYPPSMSRSAEMDRGLVLHYRGLSQRYDDAQRHGVPLLAQAQAHFAGMIARHGEDPRLLYIKAYNDFAAFAAAAQAGEQAASSAYVAEAKQAVDKLRTIEANDDMLAAFAQNISEAYAQDLSNRGRHAEAIATQRRLVAEREAALAPQPRTSAIGNLAWSEMILGLVAKKAGDRALTCQSWRRAEGRWAGLERRDEIVAFQAGFLPGLRANLKHCAAGAPLSAFGPLR